MIKLIFHPLISHRDTQTNLPWRYTDLSHPSATDTETVKCHQVPATQNRTEGKWLNVKVKLSTYSCCINIATPWVSWVLYLNNRQQCPGAQ
jgi:hypothetical protein